MICFLALHKNDSNHATQLPMLCLGRVRVVLGHFCVTPCCALYVAHVSYHIVPRAINAHPVLCSSHALIQLLHFSDKLSLRMPLLLGPRLRTPPLYIDHILCQKFTQSKTPSIIMTYTIFYYIYLMNSTSRFVKKIFNIKINFINTKCSNYNY